MTRTKEKQVLTLDILLDRDAPPPPPLKKQKGISINEP